MEAVDIREEELHVSATNHFIAGWVGGSAGIIVGHPFDTVKVQVQTTEKRASLSGTISSVRRFGWSQGFYRGISFPLASQGALCALFFAGYGYTNEMLRRIYPEVSDTTRAFVAGCVGGAVQLLPCCPVEIVKCNLQARLSPDEKRFFKGPLDCLRSIYQTRGLSGCFRGLPVHGSRDIIGYGIYTSAEVFFLNKLHFFDTSAPMAPGSFLAGGLAGCVSWVTVTPIDVVKSRIQANDLKLTPRQLVAFIANIARTEGLRSFFKGGFLLVLRAFPANMVTLPLYHATEQALKGDV